MAFWRCTAVVLAALVLASCYTSSRDLMAGLQRVSLATSGATATQFVVVRDANGNAVETAPGAEPFSIQWMRSTLEPTRVHIDRMGMHYVFDWSPVEFVLAPPPSSYALTSDAVEYLGRSAGTDYFFVRVFEGKIFVFEPACNFTRDQRLRLGLDANATDCNFTSLDQMRRAFDMEQDENNLLPTSYYIVK